MKKAIVLIFAILFSIVSMAQNGYRVEVKQVFPTKATVYSNVFNFKREMDNAISTQTAKLNGNCNYQVFITTPSGKETRNIQNINWVQTVNGVKSYHKKRTSPNRFYDAATVWEGYTCNIDGSRKGKTEKKEFVYRVAFADNPDDYKTAFVDEETASAEALRLFSENAKDDRLVEVVVYKFEKNEIMEHDRKTNKDQIAVVVKQNEAQKTEQAAEEKQKAFQQKVSGFIADMEFIQDHCDSLKIIGVHDCCNALKKFINVPKVPKGTFESNNLDSLYLSVLLNDVLPSKDKDAIKARKKVKTELKELEKLQKEPHATPEQLLSCSNKIDDKLNKPSSKKGLFKGKKKK